MNKTASKILWKLGICALLLIAVNTKAQNVQYTAGNPNSQVGLESRVDPSSLGLNLTISLGSYSGRQIHTPVVIRYNSKVWNIRFQSSADDVQQHRTYTYTEAFYGETSHSGWSNNLMPPVINYDDVLNFYDEYGRRVDINKPDAWQFNDSYFVVPRLRIRTPDGALREFRRGDWVAEFRYGRPNPNIWVGNFYSVDGSSLRYNVEERTLYLPDGSRYTHEPNVNAFNKYIDRNGNVLTYTGNGVTDTLGRAITAPPAMPASPQDINYSLSGLNNNNLNHVFKWRYLADSLTTSEPLRYAGDCAYLNQPLSPTLFQSDESDGYVCPSNQSVFNPIVLKEIVLPDGTSYKFTYNVWGEVDKIVYPTGSYERFEYATIIGTSFAGFPYSQANRGVVKKWLSKDGTSASEILSQFGNPNQGIFSTIYPDNTKSERTYAAALTTPNYGFEDQRTGLLEEEKFYDSAGVLIKRSLSEYQITGTTGTPPPASGFTSYYPVSSANRDARAIRSINLVFEPGSSHALATMTETVYDSNSDIGYFAHLNPKTIKSYHYIVLDVAMAQTASRQTIAGYFANTPPVSISETDYLYDANYKTRNIIGLSTETRILNPTNPSDVLSKNQNIYDEQNQYYSMLDYGSTTGYEAVTGNNAHLRGNLTTKRTWNKDTNTWIESHTQFDNFGNIRKVWDTTGEQARHIETFYDPFYKYAYITKVTAPAPDPSGVHGTNDGSEITNNFDFTTGLPLSITDTNGQTITTEYDNLLRPKKIIPPAGGSITEKIYSSDVNNFWIKVRTQIDENNWSEKTTFFDKLSRPYKTQTKDLQGDVFTEIKYDNFGRAEKFSNPYRQGEQIYWSKTRYDNQNRAVETFAPALEGQQGASSGTIEFGISALPNLVGYVVTTKDASGRKNRAITNLYGILRIDEATALGGTVDNDLGTLANPHQPTSYSYSVKGELLKITQGNPNQSGTPLQNRYFMYDSLGRIIRVRQPEQTPNPNLATTNNPENNLWTSAYTYGITGKVVRLTDAKGINIINEYDRAGRPIERCYTRPAIQTTATECSQLNVNTQISLDTPQISYFYDGRGLDSPQPPAFSKGSLTKVKSSVSETRYTSFDNLGRLLSSEQRTPISDNDLPSSATPRVFQYKYNLSGALIEETYPSLRVVKNILDADGGLASVSSKAGAGQFKTLAANFDYAASGAVRKMMLGNGRWETTELNERFQLNQIGLGNSPTDKSIWKVDYEYGEIIGDTTSVDTTKNIGNIARQTITIPTMSFVQTYKYDALNRLTEAKETSQGGAQNWKQTFDYDRFGNRTNRYQKVGEAVLPINNLTLPIIDPTDNRFVTGQGYLYDYNGNLIADAEGRSFTFNGEDRQIEVRETNVPNGSPPIGKYYFDGNGARVKKVTNTETTIFVYDASGKLAAEYSTNQNPEPTTNYLTTDKLGSVRVVTNKMGNTISRRDFMPFGEELGAGVGGRTEALKYTPTGGAMDAVRKRFTGYEKDTETELDFAQARMYQNKHGRFTAVDPLMASANVINPQTFNRYTYTGNNPVNYTDPNGLAWCQNEAGTATEFTGIDKPCRVGWNNITGSRVTLTDGDWSDLGGQLGDEVILNANGTITVIRSRVATQTGAEVESGIGDVVENTVSKIITEITPRSFAPTIPDAPPIDLPTGSPPGPGGELEVPSGGDVPADGSGDPGGGDPAEAGGDVKGILLWLAINIARYKIQEILNDDPAEEEEEEEEEIELFRGVRAGDDDDSDWVHERFELAYRGMAIPLGGTATPEEHNLNDTNSIYTSWTRDFGVAQAFARQHGNGGVVLTKKFPVSRLVASPDRFDEDEVLVVGPVKGAEVTWVPPLK